MSDDGVISVMFLLAGYSEMSVKQDKRVQLRENDKASVQLNKQGTEPLAMFYRMFESNWKRKERIQFGI